MSEPQRIEKRFTIKAPGWTVRPAIWLMKRFGAKVERGTSLEGPTETWKLTKEFKSDE